ncbi:ARM repeat-containing protein [Thelephora terrestris]|uniref:ARM repeat-containing protein n=1 Tax=Thelephora terrestris TaxID=56493 RepID=A0A9P6HQP5_9AGAM|nr:ARM repeat-containing protein [Thelephora terrestris]
MEYLKSLGSAAVSTIVQKSGLNLPFSLGAKNNAFEGRTIWSLYDATKRDDGSPVSVFEFDAASNPQKKKHLPLANNALKKLRTTRHPDVLRFIDAVTTDATIYIMTERVRPLSSALDGWSSKTAKVREAWLLWGLHRIAVALSFVNDQAASTHGNVHVDSIFLSPSGEWRLGGFEVLSNPKDENAVLYTLGMLLPDPNTYAAPEVKSNGWSALKNNNPSAADSYSFALVIHFVFNLSQPAPPTTHPPHPPPQLSSRGAIPGGIFPLFKKLLIPDPRSRMTTKTFLDIGMSEASGEGSGFFSHNRLVKICQGLDDFPLSTDSEKSNMIRMVKESVNSLPSELATHRVLPALVSALDRGGASASAASIVPLLLQLGKNVPTDEEYVTVVIGPVVSLFASPDRGVRMALLDSLEDFKDKMDKKTVVDKVWPYLQTGFTDTVVVLREATIRAISQLSDKLSDRILNNDLLRHLAKLQSDPEASIRTNACILVGRLGPTLGYNTKRKVLVPAFTKALKDPFLHARVAGLMGFMATIDCFEIDELASKVIPSMSFTLVDPEKLVRDQAFKALTLFTKKLEEHAATMPETAGEPNQLTSVLGSPGQDGSGQGNLVNSAAGAAGALAGWAFSSLGAKLAPSDLHSTIATQSNANLPNIPGSMPETPVPPPRILNFSPPEVGSSKPKGMQLGSHVSSTVSHAAEWAAEAEVETSNPWGSDDLMDVNADQDDWS